MRCIDCSRTESENTGDMESSSSALIIAIRIFRYDFAEIVHAVDDDVLVLCKGVTYQRHELCLVIDACLAAECHRRIAVHVADSTVVNQSGNHAM